MVNRGRELGLVRHVGLFIPIAEYDCPQCHDFRSEDLESRAEFKDKMETIQDGLRTTFRLLRKWKRRGALSLDITVQSPSDSSHHFPHIDVDGESQATADALDDSRHGWRKGMRISWPPEGALNRLFMDITLSFAFWRRLPQVTAVTALCLRRQTTRQWNPGAVRELVKHLSGLQEFHYEPWRKLNIGRSIVTETSTLTPPKHHEYYLDYLSPVRT
jgi:hypothetical protein